MNDKKISIESKQIGRQIYYIDVAEMSEQELCALIGVKWIPWYKSTIFWGFLLLFVSPTLLAIASIMR